METKIQKRFEDTGFGFPVYLLNVPMVKVRDEWTPRINYRELSSCVLKALVEKPARLTGAEIRFIRQSLGMTVHDFGETFYVTHPAVLKWEKAGTEPTSMKWATEKDIRLFVAQQSKAEDRIAEIYRHLRKEAPSVKRTTHVDVSHCQELSV